MPIVTTGNVSLSRTITIQIPKIVNEMGQGRRTVCVSEFIYSPSRGGLNDVQLGEVTSHGLVELPEKAAMLWIVAQR